MSIEATNPDTPVTSPPSVRGDMFCRTCGNHVSKMAIACPSCGVPPLDQKNFCHQCGTATSPAQVMCIKCGVSLSIPKEKSKLVAGILAILLGTFGAHKFYLGYTGTAVFMLCTAVIGGILTFGIAWILLWIIGLVEGIIYLTKSDQDFLQTYVHNNKMWF